VAARLAQARSARKAGNGTLALVLAGGKGTRLGGLTRWDSKPAIPFGGIYRNIDFTLSNCVNSGLRRIAVLTQYRSQSLMEHLQEGWSFLPRGLGEFIEAWPAQQRVHDAWYGGTADAVCQNVDQIRRIDPEHVLVLAGDHIYAMDYRPMLARHRASGADITVACVERRRLDAAGQLGVLELDGQDRVTCFVEKPRLEALPAERESVLVSMGIYVFSTRYLLDLFARAGRPGWSLCDFGRDVLPAVLQEARVVGHVFRAPAGDGPGYWRDVGTIDSYWNAHMEWVSLTPPLDPGDPDWPVWTRRVQLPPARIVQSGAGAGTVCNVAVSPGCVVTDATIRNSVLSPGVTVEAGAVVEDCVLLPHAHVGRGSVIRRAVVAGGVCIPAGAVVDARIAGDVRLEVTSGGVTLVHTAPVAVTTRRTSAHEAA
jgi:glucose-1-phosphate adenylyltransferase